MQSNLNTYPKFSLYMYYEPFIHNGPRLNLYNEIIKDYDETQS
jgi:hypothetical protein